MAMLDTLKATRQLQQAGFPESQADALVATFADGFGENLATKHDIAGQGTELRAEIALQGTELRAEIEAVRTEIETLGTELRAAIALQGTELRAEIGAVRGEIEAVRGEMREMEQRLIIRMYVIMGGGVAFLSGVIGIATAIIVATT